MVQDLPIPEVIRCYFDEQFEPHLPAMFLNWGVASPPPPAPRRGEGRLRGKPPTQVWQLPDGVSLDGPPPQRFGISIQRIGDDAFAVRLLWNRICFVWMQVERLELTDSSLSPLLSALGTDLDYLLDQPVESSTTTFPRAA
jgi:hypothetical protein